MPGIPIALYRPQRCSQRCALAAISCYQDDIRHAQGGLMHSKLLKAVSCVLVIALACASAQARVIFSDKFEQYSLEGFGTPQEGWAIVNSPIRLGNYAASSMLVQSRTLSWSRQWLRITAGNQGLRRERVAFRYVEKVGTRIQKNSTEKRETFNQASFTRSEPA